MFPAFINSEIYTFVVIPLLIFIARIFDVSIGTIRLIFIARGFKYWAPILGFFEILIWLLAIRQIMANLSNVYCFLAYAGGFATGTFIGIVLEEKLSVGKALIRIHIKKNAIRLINALDKANYPILVFDAEDNNGKTKLISIIAKRQAIPKILEISRKYNPDVIYSIEDVRYATEDHFPFKKRKKNITPAYYRKEK